MEPTFSFPHTTPEDSFRVQQPKRSDFPSHQDEDKSPKIPTQNNNKAIRQVKSEQCCPYRKQKTISGLQ